MSSDNAGPSPRNNSTAEATSPTPLTNSKPKRQHVSTTTSSMPRPLHLALGSVVGSSSSPSTPGSNSPSPSPVLSRTTDAVRSASNGDNMGLGATSSTDTPATSRAPSPSPLSPALTGIKRHSASKRSSISYLPANGPSPSQAQYAQRSSVDGFTRSPLSSTHPPTSFFGDVGRSSGAGLSRSNSLGSRGPKMPRDSAFRERPTSGSSTRKKGSNETNGTGQVPLHLKDRPPVTLAEKHAELLHFIAQKESKCLELRSQLAVHEAELLQLKRKWERIVNRGFERSLSPGSTNPSSPVPLSASLLSTSPTSPSASTSNSGSTSLAPASYFPSLTPASTAPGTVVLEGLKGGVQGMSRLIAAGLESIVLVNSPSTPTAPSAHEIDAFMSNGSLPPRRTTTPITKNWSDGTARGHGHGQKESQSSSSTTTSAASSATFSSLSSTSTATSATSASTSASISGSSTSGNTTSKTATASSASVVSGSSDAGLDPESEFGDFEEGRASRSGRASMEQDQEQVLMVYDTGATPTMSPNPHFRRKKAVEQVKVEKLVLSPESRANDNLSVNSAEKAQDAFDWDDGWDEPASEAQAKDNSESGSLSDTGVRSKTANALPLGVSVPGLGVLNMGAPTPQNVSSWAGSVGKKWDELKGSTTFTKSQKRASVLLSDMQNTIVSALTSPPATNSPLFSSNPSTSSQVTSSFSSNASHSARSPKVGPSAKPLSRSGTSLLDDSDDENSGGATDLRANMGSNMMAPVMVPDSLSPTSAQSQATLRKTMAAPPPLPKVVDDDEWNW